MTNIAAWICLSLLIGFDLSTLAAMNSTGLSLDAVPPRVAGMAGAFSAVDGGPDSLSVNPAGIAGIRGCSILVSYQALAAGVYSAQLAGVFRIPGVGPFGVRLNRVAMPEADGVGYGEWLFSAAYGYRLLKFVDLAAAAGIFSATINDRTSVSFVMDLGCRVSFLIPRLVADHRVSAGVGVRDLGTGQRFVSDSVSLNHWFVIGASYSIARLLVAADARFLMNYEQRAVYALGAEYALARSLLIRGGVEKDGPQTRFYFGLSLAAAFASVRTGAEYAFNPVSVLGNPGSRLGLRADF